MTAVFDASFLFRGLVRTQLLPAARTMLHNVLESNEEVFAPSFLRIEFLSGLRRLERRGSLGLGELEEMLAVVADFPINYRWDDVWLDRALAIAREIGASRIYDSLYLACAEAFEATLYTCDGAFAGSFRAPHPNIHLAG